MLRTGRTQFVKWTTEGAVKGAEGLAPSILRRRAYVSCWEYDGIPLRAGEEYPESRWHRGL